MFMFLHKWDLNKQKYETVDGSEEVKENRFIPKHWFVHKLNNTRGQKATTSI